MRYQGLCLLCAALLMGVAAAPAAADEAAALKALEAKGLKRLSSYFSLPGESEIGRGVRAATPLHRKVLDAQREAAAAEKKLDEKKKLILAYYQQRRQLRAQLQTARSVTVHNRIVTSMNERVDRISLLERSQDVEKRYEAAEAAANTASEAYVEHLLQIRKQYDQVKEAYADLAADPMVAKALEAYNAASEKTYTLGPGASFLSYGKRLEKLEESVLSEEIDLRKGGGNLWHVRVMFNGTSAQEMAIDTGASICCVPWTMAEAIGLKPDSDSVTLRLSLADGSVVEAMQATADSIRLGKFTAEKVECAIMPKEMTNAAALLGLSFFKNFTYKIDTANSKLIMSKVDSSGSSR